MVNLFVVVLNWNRPDDTIECLQSLDKCNLPNIKGTILIVDNASTDNSLDRFEKIDVKKWQKVIVKNNSNLGFAAGNNVGINHALKKDADIILVLNNDTVVEKNFLIGPINYMLQNSDVSAVSPKIYFAKGFEFQDKYKKTDLGKVIWYAGGEVDWANVYGVTRGIDEVDSGNYDQITDTDFATGAALFLNAKIIKENGCFDEKYFMYYEDTDLSQRLKRKKFKVLYYPDSIVWHKVAQSSGVGSNLNDYFITRNRLLFGFKYAPLRAKLALIRESIKFLFSGRKWQKIGVRDFYLGNFGKGSWK